MDNQPTMLLVNQQPFLRKEYQEGFTTFCGRKILVDPRVLVPRKKTQTTARVAVDAATWVSSSIGRRITVADIGTGSGALIITVASECAGKDIQYFATDISSEALEVAKQNVALHNLSEQITFCQGDLLTCLPVQPDVIMANLPYLPQGAPVPSEVACEPDISLFDCEDGIYLVKNLLEQVCRSTSQPRAVILEFSPEGIPRLRELIATLFPAGIEILVHRDHEALERVVEVRWS
jgi:release factor glutamine methyltransferase